MAIRGDKNDSTALILLPVSGCIQHCRGEGIQRKLSRSQYLLGKAILTPATELQTVDTKPIYCSLLNFPSRAIGWFDQ
jgi:hypothetical protein